MVKMNELFSLSGLASQSFMAFQGVILYRDLNFRHLSNCDTTDKMFTLSNKKSTFVLVSGFLAVVFSEFCLTII